MIFKACSRNWPRTEISFNFFTLSAAEIEPQHGTETAITSHPVHPIPASMKPKAYSQQRVQATCFTFALSPWSDRNNRTVPVPLH